MTKVSVIVGIVHPDGANDLPPLPPTPKKNSHSKNAPAFDVREQLYRVTSVDLTVVDGTR
jgi:hypothetical protein